ncbi:MAG: hypothetical protein ACREFB_12180 [Stellaceae bacterium]
MTIAQALGDEDERMSAMVGLAITTLRLLAARLAGGFSPPARPSELEPAIWAVLDQGGFAELDLPFPGGPEDAASGMQANRQPQ